ncbi:integrase, catalytic region, zinc finger, CCHC-type containing protein [Tanacetum coccineum]
MTTLAEFMIIAGADNHPPMLEKSLYDSWKSHMEFYMKNRENGRMILDLVQNGPLVWPTVVQEDGTTRKKTYAELSATEKLQVDCDCKATNIDRVKLLMQGTQLSLQEKECKLYDEFDKFSFVKGLAVLVFNQRDDPISCLNKAMTFLTTVASSRNQASIQDVQQVQGRQGQSYAANSYKGNATSSGRNNARGHARVVKYPGILDGQAAQTTIPNTTAFQTEDLDAYDSDCDDVSNAKAVLMANLSNYGSDVISEEKANQEKNNESLTVELERYKERVKTFEQRLNIVLSICKKVIKSQMDGMIKEKLALKQQRLTQIKEKESLLQTFTVFKNESTEKESKYLDKEIDLEKKIKELDNIFYKVGQSAQTVPMLTKSQVFYDDTHKQAHGYQNPFYLKKAQQIKPTLYDGSVISSKHVASPVIDDEETLILEETMENADLKRQIQDKVFVITSLKNNLQKLKGKQSVGNVAQIPIATTIAPGMFKIDLEPLAPRLLNNKDAHIDYLKHTQEQADILQGIVEQAKTKQLLDNVLDFACKHAKRIQELLVYVRDTCPNVYKPSEKLIVVTPMNKVKKVKFSEPLTFSSNIKQVESSKTFDSNTPVLSSTGLKCSTSTCRSQPTCNKKNDMISQKPSINRKNKVEAQPTKVNKKNRVKEPICDVNDKHTMITPKKIVHLKETTSNSVETSKPEIKFYSKRPKQVKSGSNATDVPSSSSLVNDRLSRLTSVAKIMGYGDYQLGNVIISRVYYVEGIRHNLFSVGQFCDADLEVAFRKNTCFIWNLEGVDLLLGSRDTNLYTISLDDMLKTSLIYLLSKASKTKNWLWHRQLLHLNFGTLNKLSKDGLARGIPKLKF